MTDTLYNWSETAASNDAADATINWVENQDPNTVNNSARAMMTRLRQLINDIGPTKTSTGTANAYAVTSNAAGATYVNGEIITFIVDRANTGAATLNVDARGALPWRPGIGLAFNSGDLIAGQPVTAFYNSAAACWYSTGTGYHISALSSGISLQSITARMPQIGDLVISLEGSVGAGRIRLTETTQSVLKSSYPELNSWLSARGYPWGSTATHFSLPPAAGYFLRFAATSSAIDTGGTRSAGTTQSDQNKTATVPSTGLTATTTTTISPNPHTHTEIGPSAGTVGTDGGGAQAYTQLNTSGATTLTASSTTTMGGSATLPGGDEVRVKNIAFHLDVVASTALSAAQTAVFGFPFQWDTGITAADPGAGRVRGNNATLASITQIYISDNDEWSVDLTALLTSLVSGNDLTLSKVGAQANRLVFRLSGSPVDSGTYITVPVTVVIAEGTFASNDKCALEYSKGVSGPTGAAGAAGTDPGIRWLFDSTTTMADPGFGDLRFDNLTLSSVTNLAISELCGETGNPSVEAHLLTWDDSTSTSHYGTVIIKKVSAPQNFAVFSVTGAVVNNVNWVQVPVTFVTSSGAFANTDVLSVQFFRTGNAEFNFLQAGTGAVTRTGQTKLREVQVSVKDFGALGDGVTDDTLAIQAAIDSLTTGGEVHFPIGTYLFSVSIKPRAAVRLSASPGTATLKHKDASNLTTLIDFSTYSAHGAELAGLIFDGNRSNNTSTMAVERFFCSIATANDVIISDCTIKSYAGHGVYISSGLRAKIQRNYFYDLYFYGVYVNRATYASDNHIITDNRMDSVSWHAINLTKCSNARIERNTIVGTRIVACVVTVVGTAVTWVSGTTFAGASPGNFLVYNGGVEALISVVNSTTSLTLSSATGDAASVAGAIGAADVISSNGGSGNRITDNIVIGGTSLGISLAGSDAGGNDIGTIVTGNAIGPMGSAGISVQTEGAATVLDAYIVNNKTLETGYNNTASADSFNHGITISGAASRITLFGNSHATYDSPSSSALNVVTAGAVTKSSGILDIDGGSIGGFRNRLINAAMRINQRAAATNADDTYAFDRWNILTQTGTVAVSQITSVEDSTPHMMRITQSQAVAQRFGAEQIIENLNCHDLRGRKVVLSARVRCSASTTLRYAILEWTSTADSVTSDVVADWTSGTYTAANFFLAASLTVTATGSKALTANTLTNIALPATLSSSTTNLIVLFWTSSTQAQNVTLDIGKVQLERGETPTVFEDTRPYSAELQMCQRYFYKLTGTQAALGVGGFMYSDANQIQMTNHVLEKSKDMRSASPTCSFTGTQGTDWGVTTSGGVNQTGFTISYAGSYFQCSKTTHGLTANTTSLQVLTTSGAINLDAEL